MPAIKSAQSGFGASCRSTLAAKVQASEKTTTPVSNAYKSIYNYGTLNG